MDSMNKLKRAARKIEKLRGPAPQAAPVWDIFGYRRPVQPFNVATGDAISKKLLGQLGIPVLHISGVTLEMPANEPMTITIKRFVTNDEEAKILSM